MEPLTSIRCLWHHQAHMSSCMKNQKYALHGVPMALTAGMLGQRTTIIGATQSIFQQQNETVLWIQWNSSTTNSL
eukprot:797300-Ditylum_brightwellii.AAC.1